MSKKVALVGHCGPDSSYLKMAVMAADKGIVVVSADDDQSLKQALDNGVDLVLMNRVLDFGFDEHEGVELIRKLRAHYPDKKIMLVSNYAEAQAQATAAGASPGFGKREAGSERVRKLIREALAETANEPAPKSK